MSINKNTRTNLAYVVLVCMLMTLMSPILAYADVNNAAFVSDGEVYTASVTPYQNDLGLMASALDLAEVFGYGAEFDSESKSIEIESENHGKVVLMHNATEFYSNGTTFPYAKYFYSENNVPMVEVGFFTTMFGASYTYDADTNTVSIDKNKLSDSVAKVKAGDVTLPLYITPFMNEYGLTTSLKDLAKAIGAEITVDPETFDATLTDDTKGEINLINKGETFTSDFGTFECLPMYYAEEGIPMIALDFFCALYGISYHYDEATKTVNINTELTQDELDKEMSKNVSLMSESNFSGWLNFNEVDYDSMNIKVVLQHLNYRSSTYNSGYYYIANSEVVTTEEVTPENPSMYFEFNSSDYYNSNYFILSFEDEENGFYAYMNSADNLVLTDNSLIYNDNIISSCMKYNNYSNYSIDMYVPTAHKVTGKVTLPETACPDGSEIEVNLLMQVRGAPYTSTYGNVSYSRYTTYSVKTLTFDSETTEQNYTILLDSYYISSYPYISLFYTAYDGYKDSVMPYGYYNQNDSLTFTSSNRSSYITPDAKYMHTQGSYVVNFDIPYRPDYVPPTTSYIEAIGTSASQGQKISIPVKISDNPGIAYLRFAVEYDHNYLTFDSVDIGTVFEEDEVTEGIVKDSAAYPRKYYTFLAYTGIDDKTSDGTVATFNFTVNDEIDLSYTNYTEIYLAGLEAYNIDEEPVSFNIENAIVNLTSVKCGDINADGLVNGSDLLRLAKYFAGWDVELNEMTFDANGDGKINRADLLRLAKYLLDPDNVTLG